MRAVYAADASLTVAESRAAVAQWLLEKADTKALRKLLELEEADEAAATDAALAERVALDIFPAPPEE